MEKIREQLSPEALAARQCMDEREEAEHRVRSRGGVILYGDRNERRLAAKAEKKAKLKA